MQLESPIILFDGICNLCNSSVQFIIKRDKNAVFKFASLQSPTGQEILQKLNLSTQQFDSIVLTDKSMYWSKSTAALEISKKLDGAWPLFYIFIYLPKGLRDSIYDIVAKNRYRWFGKQESCWIPTAELKERFI